MEAQRAIACEHQPRQAFDKPLARVGFNYCILIFDIWYKFYLIVKSPQHPVSPGPVWGSGSKPLWRYWPRCDSLFQKVPTDKDCDKSLACFLQLWLYSGGSCQKHAIFPKGNSSGHMVCRPASPQALTTANCMLTLPCLSSSETLFVSRFCRVLTSLSYPDAAQILNWFW